MIPDNAFGILKIPSLGVEVKVYKSNDEAEKKKILDAYDSALLYHWGAYYCVADHANSGGAWNLEKLKLGANAEFIDRVGNGFEFKERTTKFQCYAVMKVDVVDHEPMINGQKIKPYHETDLLCSCCVGADATKNYIAMFEKV